MQGADFAVPWEGKFTCHFQLFFRYSFFGGGTTKGAQLPLTCKTLMICEDTKTKQINSCPSAGEVSRNKPTTTQPILRGVSCYTLWR